MTLAFQDSSFTKNIAGLLIATMLLLGVVLGSQAAVQARPLTATEMVSIEGKGVGTALLVGGILLACVGIAVIATGGIVAVAAAFAVEAVMVSAGLSAVTTGTMVASIGTGMAAYGDWLD